MGLVKKLRIERFELGPRGIGGSIGTRTVPVLTLTME